MIKTLDLNHKAEWKALVTSCDNYDFYHTWDYHNLSKQEQGTPILIVYKEAENLILLPLIKREINDSNGRCIGFDYTSVYGYAGPIKKGTLKDKTVKSFGKFFIEHCLQNRIVSVFSRLHPTIKEQEYILKEIGIVEDNSKTIKIDLSLTLQEQRSQYRKSNKSEINKLKKTCDVVWSNKSEKDIDVFISIYEATMHRVKAHERYFFDRSYYKALLNSEDFKTELCLVRHEDEYIAGALFIFCGEIIQYHLAGTKSEFMKMTPMKLILDEVRIKGTELGYKIFHLGGGTSDSLEDPLFRFKRGFSKDECTFKTFKLVVNDSKYDEITKTLIKDKSELSSNYFPIYRI